MVSESVKTSSQNTENEEKIPKYGYGVRHVQLALFLLCLTVNIIGRTHIGVTIVAMTISPNISTPISNNGTSEYISGTLIYSENGTENSSLNFAMERNDDNSASVNGDQNFKTWIWPKYVQELVLNAFFLGYMIMMFPMGLLCQRYGGKLPLQIGLFVNGIVSLATPWLTVWGDWKALCVCRILQGLSQAGTYPCIQSVLGKWVPASERATLGCCVHTGLTIGTVIAFQLAGFLGATKWGWPSIFYAIGVIFLICFIIITIFGASNPSEHKSVTEKEKMYIMGSINEGKDEKPRTPWRAIFTSKPVWGAMTAHIGSNIISILFFNQTATYLHFTQNIDVRNSGLLSSLPYVAGFFTMLLFGWLSDYCTNNNIISKNNARRISNTLANVAMATCLITTSYTNNTLVVVICLIIGISFNMGINSGWVINYVDLAPDFSGTLTAIGNTLANIFNLLMPGLISYIITDMTNITQWRLLFFITSGVAILANAVFVILISTDVQMWNYGIRKVSFSEDKKREIKANETTVTSL